MNFKGLLDPILPTLDGASGKVGQLRGKRIPFGSGAWPVFIAKDHKGKVHFLVAPKRAPDSRFDKFKLTSLSISFSTCCVAAEAPGTYLDLWCLERHDAPSMRPFIGLCEDILFEIDKDEKDPEDAVFQTLLRWRRFWDQTSNGPVRPEWVKGLMGELTLLEQIVGLSGLQAVRAWMGPESFEHDFSGNGIGVEVKTTMRTPPSIEVSGINQLDPSNFRYLFLCVYRIEQTQPGESLPSLVERLEELLYEDEEILELFWGKLVKVGYEKLLENEYRLIPYFISAPIFYRVSVPGFPCIIPDSFVVPPEARISSIRYTLELSGLDSHRFELASAVPILRELTGL